MPKLDQQSTRKTRPVSKLAFLTPGMGAVATTLYAGVEAVKKKLALPVGSLTQMGKIANGPRVQPINQLLPLARLDQIVFGGWDIFPDDAYEAALAAEVLNKDLLSQLKTPLSKISPMKAVFDQKFVRMLKGSHVKKTKNKRDLADQVRDDIRSFVRRHRCSHAVMINCASTESYIAPASVHQSVVSFERGLKSNDSKISPSMIYAYAALKENVPYANGTASQANGLPFLRELALQTGTVIAGSDFKTGQTFMKTVIAAGLRKRLLGVRGWYSTNILGNRDGKALSDPTSFRSKEVTKKSVLNEIFSSRDYPQLYKDLYHRVEINYYPPRGDNKEGWDNIDIFGWLNYPMQIKVNLLARDSILAAPIVLDLGLFLTLAQQKGRVGPQDWLSFYFKSPMVNGGSVEHDTFVQYQMLEEALRAFSARRATSRKRLTAA